MHCAAKIIVAFGWVLAAGCATVNPRPDLESARQMASDAVGREVFWEFQGGNPEAIAALTADGLSLDEAQRVAMLNNRDLRAGLAELGMARADFVQAGLLSNPRIDAAIRFPAGGGLANVDAGVAQSIGDLWRIPHQKRAKKRALDGAILRTARQASRLCGEVRAAYHRVVSAEQTVVIEKENLALARKLLDISTAILAAGSGTEVETNLARSEVQGADLRWRKAELEVAEARRELLVLLGPGVDGTKLVLSDPVPSGWHAGASESELLEWAFAWRLDLKAGEAWVEEATAQVVIERKKVWSSLAVGVGMEREARSRSSNPSAAARAWSAGPGQNEEAFDQPLEERDSDVIVGPTVEWELPLFDQNQAGIARAEYELARRTELVSALRHSIEQDVRTAAVRARIAGETDVFFQNEVVPLRARNLELARREYQEGVAAFSIVLEAQRALATVRVEAVAARREAADARVALEQAVGREINADRGFEK